MPADVVERVRAVCGALPETTENPAWAGTQWRIRKRTFAHVLAVDYPDAPPERSPDRATEHALPAAVCDLLTDFEGTQEALSAPGTSRRWTRR